MTLRDLRLPAAVDLNPSIPSSGLLRGLRWFETDVFGLPICPISRGHCPRSSSLTLEDGTDRYSRNVCFKSPYAA
jgi:hypothetical protein